MSDTNPGTVEELIDRERWASAEADRDEGRRKLREVSERWDDLTGGL